MECKHTSYSSPSALAFPLGEPNGYVMQASNVTTYEERRLSFMTIYSNKILNLFYYWDIFLFICRRLVCAGCVAAAESSISKYMILWLTAATMADDGWLTAPVEQFYNAFHEDGFISFMRSRLKLQLRKWYLHAVESFRCEWNVALNIWFKQNFLPVMFVEIQR